jgi:hypothetical protein
MSRDPHQGVATRGRRSLACGASKGGRPHAADPFGGPCRHIPSGPPPGAPSGGHLLGGRAPAPVDAPPPPRCSASRGGGGGGASQGCSLKKRPAPHAPAPLEGGPQRGPGRRCASGAGACAWPPPQSGGGDAAGPLWGPSARSPWGERGRPCPLRGHGRPRKPPPIRCADEVALP